MNCFVAKIYFRLKHVFVGAMEEDYWTKARSCLSTTHVNAIFSPTSCFSCEKCLFRCFSGYPLITGFFCACYYTIHIFGFRVSIIVLVSCIYTCMLHYCSSFFSDTYNDSCWVTNSIWYCLLIGIALFIDIPLYDILLLTSRKVSILQEMLLYAACIGISV